MSRVNCDATVRGRYPKTKKALKAALTEEPENVQFIGNSPFHPFECSGIGIPEGTTLDVVGPDPYRDRRWYASVSRKGGKVTIQ